MAGSRTGSDKRPVNTIGSRTMTKANLTEIRKSIEYWQGKVTELENAAKYGGRNRAKRFVPRDL